MRRRFYSKLRNSFIVLQLFSLLFMGLLLTSDFVDTVKAVTWDAENYTVFTEYDIASTITVNNLSSISASCKSNSDAYVYRNYSDNHFKNFTARVEGIFNSDNGKNAGLAIFGLSNYLDDCYNQIYVNNNASVFLMFWADNTKNYVYLLSNNGVTFSTDSYECSQGVWYYFTVERDPTSITCKIYSDKERAVLLDMLSVTYHSTPFKCVYALDSWNIGVAGTMSGSWGIRDLEFLNTSATGGADGAAPAYTYVIIYPGACFYGSNVTFTVSNPLGINVSYLEVGSKYVHLGDLNLSVSGMTSVNVSQCDDGFLLAKGTSVLRFNATYTGTKTFTFYGNSIHPSFKLYDNSSLLGTYSSNSFSWSHSGSTHDFDIRIGDVCIDPPTSGNSSYDAPSNTVNLTWDDNMYSDREVVVMKTGDYPSSPNDGTIVQNSTNEYYNFSIVSNSYYSVFSYNNTYHAFSCTGLEIPWGVVIIHAVYNLSNPSMGISPFGLEISNSSGTEVYWNSAATAPLKINKDDIPFGTNTIVTINASKYKTTKYYFNYVINHLYNHTFYIPPMVTNVTPGTGDAGDTNDSHLVSRLYRIRVIDAYTYPIASVKVYVKRYINTTDTYENTSILLTDGYGEADVYLVPGVNYKVFLEKTGYLQTGSNDWTPDPVFYGANYPKVFQMSIDSSASEIKTFWDVCTFKATVYHNGSLYVEYSDSMSETINAQFYTFEIYNFTEYLNSTNTTTNDIFSFWVRNLNISRSHRVHLFLNHTTLGYVNVSIIVLPLHTEKLNKKIEKKFIDVFGNFDLGYVNFFFIFLPLICLLVLFGPAHAEIGMIGAGLYLGISSIYLEMNVGLIQLGFVIVAIAIVYTMVKHGRMKI